MSEKSFHCQMCGHCCYGSGGIIVGTKDLSRLLTYFNMDENSFFEKYTKNINGKPCLIVGEDNFCFFFKKDKGCTIHEARPNVCRAWPYFRGNLIDGNSFEMAKEDCKGIVKTISHKEFAHDGFQYLIENNLIATDAKLDGRALIVRKEELPQK